ncbi:methyltransferase family protein [Qipengyuania marisflavi]|uniref:Protein-S-isoprenylcysteine methyltransferase n=1 Tax=Qipengyuania marisflavi TaxID=2486356 RepID=A0A5S3P955_9SPHN|nr:isoprenylcysteine carboxylmethyltransferase family protein [Qipengyuania marisflavi]TMM48984.1 protein-S-isoprenylcysteine methyltransferase [Qipengyuania marisflavi]
MTKPDGFPAALPKSDISSAVGFVGLAALILWVAIARYWAVVAETLGIAGPRLPMDGPHAAIAGVLVVALPMVLWSVFVDKVHLNATTGIDWSLKRSRQQLRGVTWPKILGLWITWAMLAVYFCLCRWYWDGNYIFAVKLLAISAVAMAVLCVPYTMWLDRKMIEPRDHAWHFGAMLLRREGWEMREVKKHWRAWMIKAFFGAFMLSIVPGNFANVVRADLTEFGSNPVSFAVTMINLLFLIDVMVGTVGYIVTFRPLDAHIRSGNPFVAGWVAALICYPPLVWGVIGNGMVLSYEHAIAPWHDWLEGSQPLLWAWAGLLVFLTAVYAWATFAFGLRFSNLTYRGVVTNGPYRFTRHPAYVSKNLFWWFGGLPFLVTNGNPVDAIRNAVFLLVVNGIYYWRARTEEAHLLAEDPKYREYYDWMGQHGLITAPLTRLALRLRPTGEMISQPAE